jgi:tetratricopeptide (TPR) repeat protein
LRQGRWQAARTCYQQALRLCRDLGDRRGEAAVLGNLGSVAQELGELAAAVTYHQQDLAISREIGNRHGEGQALANLGESLLRQDHWQTAIRTCEQAITIAQELGDHDTEGWALNTRGKPTGVPATWPVPSTTSSTRSQSPARPATRVPRRGPCGGWALCSEISTSRSVHGTTGKLP